MKLEKVDLEYPEIFKEVLKKVKNIIGKDENAAIGGGSLSDYYIQKTMESPLEYFKSVPNGFNDIDIFYTGDVTEEDIIEEFGNLEETFPIYSQDRYSDEKVYLHEFDYKGYRIQLIQTRSLRRIYDFDFRFRQFYLFDEEVYASSGALEDIKNKKLFLVNPSSPRSSFCRLKDFEDRYQFKLDEKSYHYLHSFLNFGRYYYGKFIDYIKHHKKLNEHQKEELVQEISSYYKTEYGNKIYFNPHAKSIFHPSIEKTIFKYIEKEDFNLLFSVGILGTKIEKMLEFNTSHLPQTFDVSVDFEELKLPHLGNFKDTIQQLQGILKPLYGEHRFIHLQKRIHPEEGKIITSLLNGNVNDNFTQYFMQNSHFLINFMKTLDENKKINYAIKADMEKKLACLNFQNGKFQICFDIPTDYHFLADTIERNTITAHVEYTDVLKVKEHYNRSLTLYFKKCTNGKYTLSSSSNISSYNINWALLTVVLRKIQEKYPDNFEFFNKELVGEFDYLNTNFEYFFNTPRVYNEQNCIVMTEETEKYPNLSPHYHKEYKLERITKNYQVPLNLNRQKENEEYSTLSELMKLIDIPEEKELFA